MLLLQIYVFTFPLVTALILNWNKLGVGKLLPRTCQIHTLRCYFVVPLTFFPIHSRLLAESPLPFLPWTSLFWCRTFYMGKVLIKYILIQFVYSAVPVTFGHLVSIGSASVTSTPFDILFLLEAYLISPSTPNTVWCSKRLISTYPHTRGYFPSRCQLALPRFFF